MTRSVTKEAHIDRQAAVFAEAMAGILRNLAAGRSLVECVGCERTVHADAPCRFCAETLRLLSVRRARERAGVKGMAA